jgi:mannan endo-1,4-beta-mannosidase
VVCLGLALAACAGDEGAGDEGAGEDAVASADAGPDAPPEPPPDELVDPLATAETRALFRRLRGFAAEGGRIMFGQEFPTDYRRVTGLSSDTTSSDCKDVVGQHPAVFGSDFHFFLYKDASERQIHEDAVRAAHARGAMVTFDWHMYGRYKDSFGADAENAELVAEIVEDRNGSRQWFYGQLDQVIAILQALEHPVVFRPFHEMSGNWFWWGSQVGASRYVALFRLTVDYMKQKDVHNVLYCWSTSRTTSMEFYPGDEYVDILGTDGYEPGGVPWFTTQDMLNTLGFFARYAEDHGKVAAFTETGHREGYPDVEPEFWTKRVLEPILADPDARKIVWVLTWIHATWSGPYIPYPGMEHQTAIDDFIEFYEHPATLFEDDLPDLYH